MMLPLRIRKAEVALADGRLEEALQQASREDVRDHRKGQRLIGRLTKAYEKRSRVHLGAGNFLAAMADADKAVRLGGNQPAIIALREEVKGELDAWQSEKQARNRKLAAAKRCLAAGDYSLGAKLCDDVDDGDTAVGIMQDAEINRRKIESSVERGMKAIKAGHWEQAIDAIDEISKLKAPHSSVSDLVAQVASGVTKQARQLIAKGRLDQADLYLQRIRRHVPDSIELKELSRFIDQCRSISTKCGTQHTDVVARLKALKLVIPEARWLDAAIKDSEMIARSLENLQAGPLGALLPASATELTVVRESPRSVPPVKIYEATPVIPKNFLIHLDGTGSVLVARGEHVTFGTPSRSRQVDVPIQSQIGMSAMTIERMDEDYFLTSELPLVVNGRTTTNTLLNSQDQIRVGRRGSLQFALPNSASTSATIDFAGIRLASGNARRVILMDDSLIIGPQPSAHIQSLAMERTMVLHWRDGELRIRPLSRHSDSTGATIELDRPHDVDGLSLVVTSVAGVV